MYIIRKVNERGILCQSKNDTQSVGANPCVRPPRPLSIIIDMNIHRRTIAIKSERRRYVVHVNIAVKLPVRRGGGQAQGPAHTGNWDSVYYYQNKLILA